jgi:pimeloyl-ACP methyl ester carboxylesterase
LAGQATAIPRATRIIRRPGDQSAPVERRFELPQLALAAREWGDAAGQPVIALHGWLDNAGSFDLLAPLLGGCHLIALDAAGHGLSDHRSADAGYNIWQDVGDVLEVASALGWQRFNLLGHSRGAAVATLFAGTFPDRVDRLLLLEGGLPILGEAADAPANLARVIERSRELSGRGGRIYASRAEAITERVNGFTPVTAEAAEILARRSLVEVAGGWQWQADQRLKAGSEFRLTREELIAFLVRVEAPTLCLMAEDSPFADRPGYRELLEMIAGIEIRRLPGRHHFHLETAATAIAASVTAFLAPR